MARSENEGKASSVLTSFDKSRVVGRVKRLQINVYLQKRSAKRQSVSS